MKDVVSVLNSQIKQKINGHLISNKEEFIGYIKSHEKAFLEMNALQRLVALDKHVLFLSFYSYIEVKSVIKPLGLKKYTPMIFKNHLEFFEELDQLDKRTKYLYPYNLIWGYYLYYSLSVIKERIALDLDIDLSVIASKVNRQMNNKSFPPVMLKVLENNTTIFDEIKKESPYYKMDISDKNPFTSIMHMVKYPHKNELYNLYMELLNFNKEVNHIRFYEPDFKEEFYNLLEIVLRDKSLLGYYETVVEDYGSLRRFKIKRVESLILSKKK